MSSDFFVAWKLL